jgi:hypothetical protein
MVILDIDMGYLVTLPPSATGTLVIWLSLR